MIDLGSLYELDKKITLLNNKLNVKWLKKCVNLSKVKELKDIQRQLRDLILKLERIYHKEEPLRIGVFGEFSAGKSMFINSLLGEALLWTDVIPSTAKVSVLRYEELEEIYGIKKGNGEDECREKIERSEWRKMANRHSEIEEPTHYDYFEVYYPANILKLITLIDTPGFSEKSDIADKITREWINKVDIIFYITDVTIGLKQTDKENLKKFGEKIPVVCILNKADLLSPDERKKQKEKVESDYKFKDVIIYSAKQLVNYNECRKKIDRIRLGIIKLLEGSKFIVQDNYDGNTQLTLKESGGIEINIGITLNGIDEDFLEGLVKIRNIIEKFKKDYENLKFIKLEEELHYFKERKVKSLFEELKEDIQDKRKQLLEKMEERCGKLAETLRKEYENEKENLLDSLMKKCAKPFVKKGLLKGRQVTYILTMDDENVIEDVKEKIKKFSENLMNSAMDKVEDIVKQLELWEEYNPLKQQYKDLLWNVCESHVNSSTSALKGLIKAQSQLMDGHKQYKEDTYQKMLELAEMRKNIQEIIDLAVADEQIFKAIERGVTNILQILKNQIKIKLNEVIKHIESIEGVV